MTPRSPLFVTTKAVRQLCNFRPNGVTLSGCIVT